MSPRQQSHISLDTSQMSGRIMVKKRETPEPWEKEKSEIRLLNSAFKPEDDGGNLNFKATHKDAVKNLDGKFLARVRDFNAPKSKETGQQPLEEFIPLLVGTLSNAGSFARNDEINSSAFEKFQGEK